MRLDLIGSVNQLPLTPVNCLYPVFEAVSNAMHAIRDGRQVGGRICVELIRDDRQTVLEPPNATEPVGRPTAEIVEIRITDNGVGFTDENLSAFGELYTRRKAKVGGKGVGRLTWLKVFEYAKVVSIYHAGGDWRRRSFAFVLPNGLVDPVDEPIGQMPPESTTTVTLANPRKEFREALRRRASTVRDAIARHFLVELLAPNPPRIDVVDDEGRWIVALDGVSGRRTAEFLVKEKPFKVEHLRIKSPERRQHIVHYCADLRSVRTEQIKSLPDVRFQDGDDEFYYHAYVSSPYLDAHVDQQRTGFAIQEDNDLVPELSLGDIRLEVGRAAGEYLEPYIAELIQEKQARVERVLDHVFPEQRYLREQNGVELDRIPVDFTERQIRDEVARIHFNNVKSGRELMTAIIDEMKSASTIDFSSFVERFGNRLEEITRPTQADLASYMLFRRSIIDMYRELMRKSKDRFEKEAAIHQLIFPMGKDHDTAKAFFPNNLWLLDERLTYASYIASDRPLNQHDVLFGVADRGEPDIVCYFNLGFSTDDPAEGNLKTVVIVEFKRPGPLARREENPWDQVLRYIDKIRDGFWNEDGQKIKADESTRFYCYIVCDLGNDIIGQLVNHREFTPLFDGSDGYFRYNERLRAYVELVPFEKVLKEAERKHRAFFDRLGLDPRK